VNEVDILKELLARLEKLNIPYALTGGFTASFYGKPRSTHDFDLVIQISSPFIQIKKFLSAFEKDFYISEESVIDSILHKTMFNVIHHETGLKIDFWILKDDNYSREAFSRRKKVNALDINMFILSAEDMIINKLQWYKTSGVDKHLSDAKGIYYLQKENLDAEYLKKWTVMLSIADLFNKF
jgi:hypothetical protein